MPNNSRSPKLTPEVRRTGTVAGHFMACWRGENGLKDALFASVILAAIINIPLGFLISYAKGAGWAASYQLMIGILGLAGGTFVTTWFSVSMWRSARREFILGKRFLPIVASLLAMLAAGAFATFFVVGLADALMR